MSEPARKTRSDGHAGPCPQVRASCATTRAPPGSRAAVVPAPFQVQTAWPRQQVPFLSSEGDRRRPAGALALGLTHSHCPAGRLFSPALPASPRSSPGRHLPTFSHLRVRADGTPRATPTCRPASSLIRRLAVLSASSVLLPKVSFQSSPSPGGHLTPLPTRGGSVLVSLPAPLEGSPGATHMVTLVAAVPSPIPTAPILPWPLLETHALVGPAVMLPTPRPAPHGYFRVTRSLRGGITGSPGA